MRFPAMASGRTPYCSAEPLTTEPVAGATPSPGRYPSWLRYRITQTDAGITHIPSDLLVLTMIVHGNLIAYIRSILHLANITQLLFVCSKCLYCSKLSYATNLQQYLMLLFVTTGFTLNPPDGEFGCRIFKFFKGLSAQQCLLQATPAFALCGTVTSILQTRSTATDDSRSETTTDCSVYST